MKSDRGEIEVFLCPEEDALNMNPSELSDTDSEVTASPLKIKKEDTTLEDLISIGGHQNGPGSSTVMPPSGPTWEAPSRTGGPEEDQSIRNVLIWESEDLGPIGNRFQQQTVDQDNHGKLFRFLANFSIFNDFLLFLPILLNLYRFFVLFTLSMILTDFLIFREIVDFFRNRIFN